jgi:lipoyl-dependent peroxiredoxin subunit D
MTIEDLKTAIPDYAKDIRLNLGAVLGEDVLTAQQRFGTFLAVAYAIGNGPVIRAAEAEAVTAGLTAEAVLAAKAAAAIMGMNNIYYRFVHLSSSPEYGTMQAKLRMNIIANPGVAKEDFELWSLAVSAVNGCGKCIDAHEAVLRKAGMTTEQVQAAVRIAAVVHAAARVIAAEAV